MKDVKQYLCEIADLEQKIRDAVQAELEQVGPVDGVKEISQNPQCFTVSVHTIMQHNYNLSPLYYDSASQRDALIQKLHSTSPNRFKHFLEESLQKGAIVLHGEWVSLNPPIKSAIERVLADFTT